MKFFALILVCFALASCAPKTPDKFSTRKGHLLDALLGSTPYQRLFYSKTQDKSVYSEFEPVLKASITVWDQKLREAYVKEFKSQLRLSDDEEAQLATEQLQENEAYIVLIVTVATREPEWNDLDKQKSIWRILLENDDSSIQILPERIEQIPNRDEQAKYFYPTMSGFTKTYKIRFNRKFLRDVEDLVFRITGVRGSLMASIHEVFDGEKSK